LIILNVFGLFITLRNNDIYQERHVFFKNDISMTEKEAKAILYNLSLPKEDYVVKVTETVNKAMAHYWENEGIIEYNLRIPIYENYLLFAAGYLLPEYRKYEFCNHHKALERGVGLCSQHAIVAAGFLEEGGFDTKLIQLSGHFVASVKTDDSEWWTIDPDFGVVINHSLSEIEKNPSIIIPYYESKGYDSQIIDEWVTVYGKEGNIVNERGVWEWNKCYIEYLSYILIWAIPLVLITPIIFSFRKDIYNNITVIFGRKISLKTFIMTILRHDVFYGSCRWIILYQKGMARSVREEL